MNVRKPNAFLYFLAYIIVYPYLKIFFHLKVDRRGLFLPKKEPYIVLSNHSTMFDFLISMLSLYPRRLNAVTAQKFFYYSPMHKLLPMAGCIPKNMFDPDIRSIIGIKTVLKRGDGVILFPEGRCSHSQAFAGIHISTGKLLKKLGVPVISCFIQGAVNSMPLWRKGLRFGQIRVTYKNLFSADDLKTLSVDEINTAISNALCGKERQPDGTFIATGNTSLPKTCFSGRLAEGLEKLLYYCPACNHEFTTSTRNNTIYCTACGSSWDMNKQGTLTAQNENTILTIPEWYALQAEYEMQSLSADMPPIVFNAKLRTPSPKPGGGMADSGSGTMQAGPKGWRFTGQYGSEPIDLFFPVESVPAMTDDTFNNIQIFSDGKFYIFIPEDIRKCMKYLIIAECLHRKFAKAPLLTQPTM